MWKKKKEKEERERKRNEEIAKLHQKGYSILREKTDGTDIFSNVIPEWKKSIFRYTLSQRGYISKVYSRLDLEKTKQEIGGHIERDIQRLSDKCKREAQLKPSIEHIEGEYVECYLTSKKLISGILKANPRIKEKMIESEDEIYVIPSESINYIKIKKEKKCTQ